MDQERARELVVLAGKKLLEAGLIARTWGNVSCRISGSQFAITPSGRAYENLKTAEVVLVNIEDGSYEGVVKPSSEKDLHAVIYRHRQDINFIIHTHQTNASMVSPLGLDIATDDHPGAAVIGNGVACAAYGLPGSKKLAREALEALGRFDSKAAILACHGALCLGSEMEEAFRVALALEKVCADYVCYRYRQVTGRGEPDEDELRRYFSSREAKASFTGKDCEPLFLLNSAREGENFRLYTGLAAGNPYLLNNGDAVLLKIDHRGADRPEEGVLSGAALHRAIYRRYRAIRAIMHSTLPDIVAVSRTGKTLLPLLDDFAQIIGASARVVRYDGSVEAINEIIKKLKGRSAVMIGGGGALCCGPTPYDTAAAVMVLEKNCKALIGTSYFGKAKPINPLEARLMRYIYLKKYSKRF